MYLYFSIFQQLESDLALHGDQVKVLSQQSANLVKPQHFESHTIQSKTREVTERSVRGRKRGRERDKGREREREREGGSSVL